MSDYESVMDIDLPLFSVGASNQSAVRTEVGQTARSHHEKVSNQSHALTLLRSGERLTDVMWKRLHPGSRVAPVIDKLRNAHGFEDGQIAQAVVLVNNATETAWFQKLGSVASAFCFTAGRIKFNDKNGKPANSPLQGQCFIYLGDSVERFCASFQSFGLVCHK